MLGATHPAASTSRRASAATCATRCPTRRGRTSGTSATTLTPLALGLRPGLDLGAVVLAVIAYPWLAGHDRRPPPPARASAHHQNNRLKTYKSAWPNRRFGFDLAAAGRYSGRLRLDEAIRCMLISRSLGRKVVVTATAAVGVRARCTRSRSSTRATPRGRRSCARRPAPPAPGARLRVHRDRLLQGHDDRVGRERPDRHRRRRPRAAAGRLGHPGRSPGRPLQRHLHDDGHRPGGPGPPRRHLHVELQRGAGVRPAADVRLTVLRLGWNPRATTPSLLDRLFRRAGAQRRTPLPRRRSRRRGRSGID